MLQLPAMTKSRIPILQSSSLWLSTMHGAQNPAAAKLYNKEGLPASIFTTELDIPEQ